MSLQTADLPVSSIHLFRPSVGQSVIHTFDWHSEV